MRSTRINAFLAGAAMIISLLAAAGCNRSVRNLGEAMAPTLKDNQFVSVTRLFQAVDRGDIVVFRYPQDESKSFVKRVVGMPGDQISSDAGSVSINGKALAEPYVIDANRSHDSW